MLHPFPLLPSLQFIGTLTFVSASVTAMLGVSQKLQLVKESDGSVTAFGSEAQLANWTGVAIAGLMACVLYVVLGGQKRGGRAEKASLEEIESLRPRANYEHDY